MSYGSDVTAKQLLETLIQGVDFTIPEVDLSGPEYDLALGDDSALYQEVRPLTVAELVSEDSAHPGVFNELMHHLGLQLHEEFKKGRITGGEYAKAFIALTEGALAQAVQFLIHRDRAFWDAQTAQIQAIRARVDLATAKVQLASLQIEALTHQANYALTVLKLATEDATQAVAKYQVDELLPQQKQLLSEQTEAQRAQTLDQRTDLLPVTGLLGVQKDLYRQQITSYQRDGEVKAAKMFIDTWITRKTVDEGTPLPSALDTSSIQNVLTSIITKNNLS